MRGTRVGGTGLLLILLEGAFGAAGAVPTDPAEMFRKGTQAYEAGRFDEAAGFFNDILQAGVHDPRVHYNLSCALFRAGEIGRAVLHAETAAALRPGDPDARANLDYMRRQIVDRPGGESTLSAEPGGPEELLIRMADGVCRLAGADTLAMMVFIGESMSLVFLWLAWRSRRQSWQAGAAISFASFSIIFVLLAACGLGLVAWRREGVQEAVVVAEKTEALSGPGANHPALFAVHAGLKVRIRGEREGWLLVAVRPGLSGWLRAEDLGRIDLSG